MNLFKKFYSVFLNKGPRLAIIGGGTGLSVLLKGIKYFPWDITAVVSMADDGGSSGRLRNQLGMLPPGDVRNCMVALADREILMEQLFNYRFKQGEGLAGHNLGNLILAALVDLHGSFELALQQMSRVLAIRGKVLPSTLENVIIKAKLADGRVITGESKIPHARQAIKKINIEPSNPQPYKEALEAIKRADIIILGPGSLYTSIIPNLLVDGVADAISQNKGVKVYICNVMTQPGETKGYTASQHLEAIYEHSKAKLVNHIIVNNQVVKDKNLLNKYAEEEAEPVIIDFNKLKKLGVQIISKPLIDENKLVRHNSWALAITLVDLAIKHKKLNFIQRLYFKEIIKNKE